MYYLIIIFQHTQREIEHIFIDGKKNSIKTMPTYTKDDHWQCLTFQHRIVLRDPSEHEVALGQR